MYYRKGLDKNHELYCRECYKPSKRQGDLDIQERKNLDKKSRILMTVTSITNVYWTLICITEKTLTITRITGYPILESEKKLRTFYTAF